MPNLQQTKEFTEFLAELIIELKLAVSFDTLISIDEWEDDTNIIKSHNAYIKGICVPKSVAQMLITTLEEKAGE